MVNLTPTQRKHLNLMKLEWEQMAEWKYKKGAQEHGGTLIDMPELDLINEAIMENIDQYAYLWELRNKLMRRVK